MDKPFAQLRREKRQSGYDPKPMIERLRQLMQTHNESYRESSLSSGLDHQAVRRILDGRQPHMHICILMADHFGINPNEFLELGGWPRLRAFDIHTESAANLPPEAVQVAMAVARIEHPGMRKEVAGAILTLVSKFFKV